MKPFNIKEFAEEQAPYLVQAIAVAQRNGLISTEEDLRSMISAGIETAIEDFIKRTDFLGKDEA